MKNLILLLLLPLSLSFVACDHDESTGYVEDTLTPSTPSSSATVSPTVSGKLDGYDYVDLGLSVKWAVCNVGASRIEYLGKYFAWGEVREKSEYVLDNYSLIYSPLSNHPEYKEFKPIPNIAGSSYDAAHVNMGGHWRMPSINELQELVDKCNMKTCSYRGQDGFLFTASNGNSMFIPVRTGTILTETYWSCNQTESTGYESYEYKDGMVSGYSMAKSMHFFTFGGTTPHIMVRNDAKFYGSPVRAVNDYRVSGGGTGTGNGSGTGGSSGNFYYSNFTFNSSQTSATVNFYFSERVSSATVKYGKSSASSTVSSSIASKSVTARITGLTKNTTYKVKCTATASDGSSVTADETFYTLP